MSNEVILNLSFDNQTVTDLTGNWTLDGTPNATYEQIEGRDGYSIVEGSLGRCIVLNAVDQNARYDEYTVDFDMFVKPTYTSDYYIYNVFYLWSRKNPHIVGQFEGEIGEVLSVSLRIGGSERIGTTNYSPIGRWVHVTFTSGPTGEDNLYHTAVYVDGVKLVERTDSGSAYYGNPFGISQRIIPCARDPGSFLMPNGPGVCLNTYKIVAGIHAPNQKPAISLLNLSRVFNNFCTWLKRQLSTVAFTGSYNDLSNKPTISTVNDGTLTIQQNGTNVQTFTANASTNATANIQCVDLSTAQTIGGAKTFYTSATAYPIIKLKTAFIEQGLYDSDNLRGVAFRCADKNDAILGDFGYKTERTGEVGSYFSARTKVNNTQTTREVKLRFKPGSTDCELVPDTTNLIDLGSPSYQWNNAYIKSLTINGVACGDILTHNVSEFVPRSGGAVLTGTIFSRNDTTSSLVFRSGPNYADGASIQLKGKDQADASGGRAYINAHNGTASTTLTIWPTGEVIFSSALELKPSAGNSCDLGTSTNKWKSLNGIAPDELGLPTSTYTDVSSYITNFDSTANTFTAPVSGLLFIEGTNSTPTECTINNDTKQYRMTVPYAFYNIRGLFPVEKGDSITVYIYRLSNLTNAKIFHLKGKV